MTPGTVLQLIREGVVTTRAELAHHSGLSRSTVAQRVDALISAGYLTERADGPSTGGRPPARLEMNTTSGVVLVADLGATHGRLAITDLAAQPLTEEAIELRIDKGADAVLRHVEDWFKRLLYEIDRPPADVRGIGIGVPGPVEFGEGRAVSPPIMPGWDGVRIPERFEDGFPGAPVLIDNDVNIMALGEYWTYWREKVADLLYIKVATGIGCGIISDGHVRRGARGTAGDLGHVQVGDDIDVQCRCGRFGCLEAIASGRALAAQLAAKGFPTTGSHDVVELVRAGEPEAARLVTEAGIQLGHALASAVNLINPAVIVIGGDLAHAHEQLLAGVRQIVYERSTALATDDLKIVRCRLDDRAGIVGAAVTVLDHLLSPDTVDNELTSEHTR